MCLLLFVYAPIYVPYGSCRLIFYSVRRGAVPEEYGSTFLEPTLLTEIPIANRRHFQRHHRNDNNSSFCLFRSFCFTRACANALTKD